jgi:hypothetical protein
MQTLVTDLEAFEGGIKEWEMGMQIGISKNNAQINAFESDINYSLHEMSNSLNHKFKIT